MTYLTGSANITTWASKGRWKDGEVWVSSHDGPCPVVGHALEVMHHEDYEGRHYCPTGFLMCSACFGTANEPEPHSCQRWAE